MRISDVVDFIHEREEIRRQKELGMRRPWTQDEVLHTYKFCNVNREDDRTTQEIHSLIIDTCPEIEDLPWLYTMARLCNFPPTVDMILTHPKDWPHRLHKRLERKILSFSNAYSITPAGAKMGRVDFMVATIDSVKAMKGKVSRFMCEDAAAKLKTVRGLGDFMVGQIIADLKHTPFLDGAKDKQKFCLPGPGSIQGLDVIFGSMTTNTDNFRERINLLWTALPFETKEVVGDLQNLQNVCCEFAKYWRYKNGLPARKRYYSPMV